MVRAGWGRFRRARPGCASVVAGLCGGLTSLTAAGVLSSQAEKNALASNFIDDVTEAYHEVMELPFGEGLVGKKFPVNTATCQRVFLTSCVPHTPRRVAVELVRRVPHARGRGVVQG